MLPCRDIAARTPTNGCDRGRAPKALTDIHPLGKSPVIQDGTRVVAESAAIIVSQSSVTSRGH